MMAMQAAIHRTAAAAKRQKTALSNLVSFATLLVQYLVERGEDGPGDLVFLQL